MNWNRITTADQLREIREESKSTPVLIFKHSTRCSISRTALDRLERNWNEQEVKVKPYYLDLLSFRDISNLIADEFAVAHESPQVLIINQEKAVYDRSHFDIDYQQIREALKN